MQKPRPLTTGYQLVDCHAGAWDRKRTLICRQRVCRGNDHGATA